MRRLTFAAFSAAFAFLCLSISADGAQMPFSVANGVGLSYAGTQGLNAVAADLNGDGLPDIVQGINFGSPIVYLNNGTSSPFAGVAGEVIVPGYTQQAENVTVADVNGDGHPDIIAGGFFDPTLVYINNGTSDPFAGVTGRAVGHGVTDDTAAMAVGDVNGDGKPDLVTGNTNGETNKLYLNNGTSDPFSGVAGTPIGTETGFISDIKLADVNGDGKLDVIVSNYANPGDAGVRVYLNNGTSTPFTGVTPLFLRNDAGTGVIAVGDLDGDGKPDLLVSGGSTGLNWIYLNTGSASVPFSAAIELPRDPNIMSTCFGAAIADIDGDGLPDAVLGCGVFHVGPAPGAQGVVYLNNGSSDPFANAVPTELPPTSTQFSRSAQVVRLAKGGGLDILLGLNAPTYYSIVRGQSQTSGGGGMEWFSLVSLLGVLLMRRPDRKQTAFGF